MYMYVFICVYYTHYLLPNLSTSNVTICNSGVVMCALLGGIVLLLRIIVDCRVVLMTCRPTLPAAQLP
jgi:hypothetical protein